MAISFNNVVLQIYCKLLDEQRKIKLVPGAWDLSRRVTQTNGTVDIWLDIGTVSTLKTSIHTYKKY